MSTTQHGEGTPAVGAFCLSITCYYLTNPRFCDKIEVDTNSEPADWLDTYPAGSSDKHTEV